jgi:hypothetical protein
VRALGELVDPLLRLVAPQVAEAVPVQEEVAAPLVAQLGLQVTPVAEASAVCPPTARRSLTKARSWASVIPPASATMYRASSPDAKRMLVFLVNGTVSPVAFHSEKRGPGTDGRGASPRCARCARSSCGAPAGR